MDRFVGVERHFVALCLIAVGVTLVWGAGPAFITVGVGVWVSGHEFHVAETVRDRLVRVRQVSAMMPRQSVSIVVVVLGVVALAVGIGVTYGLGWSLATLGLSGLGLGLHLGWV